MDLVSPKNTAETCVALCVRHPNGHLAGRGHAVANSWRTGADICSYWSTDNTVNPYCHGVADIIQNNELPSFYFRENDGRIRFAHVRMTTRLLTQRQLTESPAADPSTDTEGSEATTESPSRNVVELD